MLDFAPSPTTPRFAFGKHDLVRVHGTEHRADHITDNGYVLVRADGSGVAVQYTRTEMARLVECGVVDHVRDALLPESARERLAAPMDTLSKLPLNAHLEAKRREAIALTFLQLEREGKVKRANRSIEAALDAIKMAAGKILSQPSDGHRGSANRKDLIIPETSARSVRRHYEAYKDLGLSGLYDAIERRGNRESQLSLDELAVMSPVVHQYMNANRPTQATIYANVRDAFKQANERRRAEGKPDLVSRRRARRCGSTSSPSIPSLAMSRARGWRRPGESTRPSAKVWSSPARSSASRSTTGRSIWRPS